MSSLYLNRLSNEQRQTLVESLHSAQKGNCFICGKEINLKLQANTIDIDHIEPTRSGGKDGPGNFGLTHDSCNRSKQSSDLRVARVLATFDAIADTIAQQDRSPNLGDVLAHYGGNQYTLPVEIADGELKTTFAQTGQTDVLTFPIYEDEISGFSSIFINLPIQYVHHDNYINPRAIGSNLRKLVEEFHKGLPQLHITLGWIHTTQADEMKVYVFDGQHKAAAQILLGTRTLPVRIFIDPDIDVLLTANTNAGTTLRQVAFDKSVQRNLGSSILSNRIDRYRDELGIEPGEEKFSERDLINHFKGENSAMRRYIVDRVRNSITTHQDNRLRDYIEYAGKSADKPLSYSTIEKTFYQFFVSTEPLTTPFNHKVEEGTNPRQLEIDQIVRLMNIIADQIYIGQYDPVRGVRRIENDVQKGVDVAEPHLRAYRMAKEEITYNWLRLVRQIVYQYFVTNGKIVDDQKLFQYEIPEACWQNIENFIDELKRLNVWASRDLSITAFGGKQNNAYWLSVFGSGLAPDGAVIMPEGLDLLEMIKGRDSD
jgi:hypothetical protein